MSSKVLTYLPAFTLHLAAPMKKALRFSQEFVMRYPAVLAAYFIYGYYFISTLDFYIAFKKKHLDASETLSHFDTLLWMWGLAWAFVRIIELREKLSTKEKESLTHQHTIQLKETQLKTLNEVVTTLKHQINNPLAIILGYVRLARRKTIDPDVTKKLGEIEIAAQRINTTMKAFSLLRVYQTTTSAVGELVVSDPSEESAETSPSEKK